MMRGGGHWAGQVAVAFKSLDTLQRTAGQRAAGVSSLGSFWPGTGAFNGAARRLHQAPNWRGHLPPPHTHTHTATTHSKMHAPIAYLKAPHGEVQSIGIGEDGQQAILEEEENQRSGVLRDRSITHAAVIYIVFSCINKWVVVLLGQLSNTKPLAWAR